MSLCTLLFQSKLCRLSLVDNHLHSCILTDVEVGTAMVEQRTESLYTASWCLIFSLRQSACNCPAMCWCYVHCPFRLHYVLSALVAEYGFNHVLLFHKYLSCCLTSSQSDVQRSSFSHIWALISLVQACVVRMDYNSMPNAPNLTYIRNLYSADEQKHCPQTVATQISCH